MSRRQVGNQSLQWRPKQEIDFRPKEDGLDRPKKPNRPKEGAANLSEKSHAPDRNYKPREDAGNLSRKPENNGTADRYSMPKEYTGNQFDHNTAADRRNRNENAQNKQFKAKPGGTTIKQERVFVPYLPQDDAGIDASETQEITDVLNKELSGLLKLEPHEFWQEVASNDSLHAFLDSYLLFRKRWYDKDFNSRVIAGEDELTRRVFMVFLRMSRQEVPGSADILRIKEVFTVSKIMDICAIYGHDNFQLTSKLVNNMLNSQPSCLENTSKVISQVLDTIDKVYERIIKNVEHVTKSNFTHEVSEVIDFLLDTFMTLDIFFDICPSAIGLCDSNMKERLLSSVTAVYNTLLPWIRKQISRETNLSTLQEGIVKLIWRVLLNTFFQESNVDGSYLVGSLNILSQDIVDLLSNRFDLSGKINKLLETGSIVLDDNQYAQLLALLPETKLNHIKTSTYTEANDQEYAIQRSNITQIKDLFPDYGDGYISACLEVYDNNPELVIQHILEGTLHSDLSTLDVTAEVKPTVAKPSVKDKGKGKVIDEQPQVEMKKAKKETGRYVRKDRDEGYSDKWLNERDVGSSAQTARLAMQILYDDEYDDSYDDLDTSVADAGLETDSLVNLVSKNKSEPSEDNSGKEAKNNRSTPRYYVKDGKHYNYKVAGAVPVSSLEEAEVLKKQEKELIHGLGRGGNIPYNVSNIPPRARNMPANVLPDEDDGGEEDGEDAGEQPRSHGRGQPKPYGRGRGRSYGGKSHHRKDLALKKHMSGLR